MPKLSLLDRYELTFLVPRDLPDSQARRAARLIDTPRFRRELTRAVRAVIRRHPELAAVRVRVSG